jgi:peroxiredoxin
MSEAKVFQIPPRRPFARIAGVTLTAALWVLLIGLFSFPRLSAQDQKVSWSSQERPIAQQIGGLRQLSDNVRGRATRQLAVEIRRLPSGANKLRLANDLANLSTEGDFGQDTLQEVATSLAEALRENPIAANQGKPAAPYLELAQLIRYEHVKASLDDAQFSSAMSVLEADDARREQIDFTLTDITGKTWTLKNLRGKVVVVNFWATWCPPCRKEMPDLDALYKRFKSQGLVILSISDEDAGKVGPFVKQMKITYPVLLDPGRKVNDLFQIYGIPKTFVYNRAGKLVAQSIDMRTRKQFLGMLDQAGIE